MAKGRKNKPDNLKVLQGTFRKDRSNPDKPNSDEGELMAPDWLPKDCREYFETVKSRLAVYDMDSASWTETVCLIAMRIHEIKLCNEDIEIYGLTYTSDKGGIHGNPCVAQRSEAMRHLQSLCAEFGLTPASICKVGNTSGKKKAKNPWEAFG